MTTPDKTQIHDDHPEERRTLKTYAVISGVIVPLAISVIVLTQAHGSVSLPVLVVIIAAPIVSALVVYEAIKRSKRRPLSETEKRRAR